MRHMRAGTAAFVGSALSVLLATSGCGGGGTSGELTGPTRGGTTAATGGTTTAPAGQPRPANSVGVTNNEFTPGAFTVAAGTTVTWNWATCSGGDGYGAGQTCVAHNVTFDSAGPHSATQSSGSFARQFTAAGAYPYHCTIHGTAMSGRIVVQ